MTRRSKEQIIEDNKLIASIITSLETNDFAVAKAVVVIGRNQTADELASSAALQHNGLGWSRVHANYGTFLYGIVNRDGQLTGKNLKGARSLVLKYARTQLFARAKEKQQMRREVDA